MKSIFRIQGMKCHSCVERIQKALQQNNLPDGEVTLHPPQVRFRSSLISKAELQGILATVGDYRVEEVTATQEKRTSPVVPEQSKDSLLPLGIIIAYLVGGVMLASVQLQNFSPNFLMMNFMGGFFVIFSLFKMINISGFADAFSTYDIVAKRSRTFALAYPFIELVLGIGYLTRISPSFLNVATFVLMSIGSIGVYQALRSKRSFQCACLGTALKLPMTKITLVEDLLMAGMALLMLIPMR